MQLFWIKILLFKERDLMSRMTSNDPNIRRHHGDGRKLTSLIAQLRKAANHPYLFPGAELPTMTGFPTEEIVSASGKMVVLDSLLKRLFAKGHRVVLFSQFTRTLDIISDYLDMREIRFCRLDGQTNRVMREVHINTFNKPNSPINIFILSTRAGGEGVNLFTADTVILFDSDWNPQVILPNQYNILFSFILVNSSLTVGRYSSHGKGSSNRSKENRTHISLSFSR
jgi:SWI/SNF-related matrix-associated actin-dependent regulator of chromatin subfamily A member 5